MLNAPMDFGKAHFDMAIVKKGIEEKQSGSRARMEVRFVCCGEWVCCYHLVLLALIATMIACSVGF